MKHGLFLAAFDALRHFAKELWDVVANGDRLLVERHGEPVAAVAPIDVYEQRKRVRAAFFPKSRAATARQDPPPVEAEILINQVVTVVRRDRLSRLQW